MIASIEVWEPMPDDDRQWVIDAAKAVPGVRDAYHPVDPNTRNGLSIVCRCGREPRVPLEGRCRHSKPVRVNLSGFGERPGDVSQLDVQLL